MAQQEGRLSQLPGLQADLKLDRDLLKDLAAETLRDHISSGRIPEGTRLTERELSQLLGISRMPVHEALIILEAEGLVVSRPDGRYVIELTEQDVRNLHAVRRTLERFAVELAAANANDENRAALEARLRELEEAVASGDPGACTRRDLAIHQAIWQQAGNPYLLRILNSMLGLIFVLAVRVELYGRGRSALLLRRHSELADAVSSGDAAGANQALEVQLEDALGAWLDAFQLQGHMRVRDS
jgi:DNA-binding GntR family transcriptional regulator